MISPTLALPLYTTKCYLLYRSQGGPFEEHTTMSSLRILVPVKRVIDYAVRNPPIPRDPSFRHNTMPAH